MPNDANLYRPNAFKCSILQRQATLENTPSFIALAGCLWRMDSNGSNKFRRKSRSTAAQQSCSTSPQYRTRQPSHFQHNRRVENFVRHSLARFHGSHLKAERRRARPDTAANDFARQRSADCPQSAAVDSWRRRELGQLALRRQCQVAPNAEGNDR